MPLRLRVVPANTGAEVAESASTRMTANMIREHTGGRSEGPFFVAAREVKRVKERRRQGVPTTMSLLNMEHGGRFLW
jgi:hypothetical protein